jgi:TRAP-type uncharacterized transport system substrate-binding protein
MADDGRASTGSGGGAQTQLVFSTGGRKTAEGYIGWAVKQVARDVGIDIRIRRFPTEPRQVAAVHEGMADLSVSVSEAAGWAYRAEAAYEGWRHTSLRAIASFFQPQWLLWAVRWEAGLISLDQLAERKAPLRVVTFAPSGMSATWAFVTSQVLDKYEIAWKNVPGWGGRLWNPFDDERVVREGHFDMIVLPAGPPFGRLARLWQQASALHNLRYLQVRTDYLDALTRDHGLEASNLPLDLFPGVELGVPSLYFPNFVLYASERLEDEQAYELARLLNENIATLRRYNVAFDAALALERTGCPPHPGALAYYREHVGSDVEADASLTNAQ